MDTPRKVPTLGALAAALEAGTTSAVKLCEEALSRITAGNEALNAVIRTTEARARAAAEASDLRRAEGMARGPLDGLPVLVKGLIAMKGIETDAGSKILAGYRPLFDAVAIEGLDAAGAVLVGQTNLDEFGMGSATAFSCHGPSANPWDLTRTPGGSSGGSAAAVAAGFVPLALGSDTGGSIRQPAALCSVAGLKPSHGRVSRRGLFAFASSLDQIGPMAPRVEDLVPAFLAIAGHDPGDATSSTRALPSAEACGARDLRGLRIGVPMEAIGTDVDAAVRTRIEVAIDFFEREGGLIQEVALPHATLGLACYHVLASAEASANLARHDGVRFGRRAAGVSSVDELYEQTRSQGFGPEVKRRIMLGTFVLSAGHRDAHYRSALQVRRLILADFVRAFEQVDLILTPSSPTPAWRHGERQEDALASYRADAFTVPASLAGLPALSVPAGFTAEGLPVGLQLIAPAFEEACLLGVGTTFERAHAFSGLAPKLRGDAP